MTSSDVLKNWRSDRIAVYAARRLPRVRENASVAISARRSRRPLPGR